MEASCINFHEQRNKSNFDDVDPADGDDDEPLLIQSSLPVTSALEVRPCRSSVGANHYETSTAIHNIVVKTNIFLSITDQ